jgi:hypothetical protein
MRELEIITWNFYDHEIEVFSVSLNYPLIRDGFIRNDYSEINHAELYGLLRNLDILFVCFETEPIYICTEIEAYNVFLKEWWSISRSEMEIFVDNYLVRRPIVEPLQKLDWREVGF